MEKTFVLRTEATLSSLEATLKFGSDNTIVIPMAILQNLYKYKGLPEKQRMANKFIEYIDNIPQNELLSSKGYRQVNGSYLRVVDCHELDDQVTRLEDFSRLDKRVFQVCLDLQKEGKKVVLISKNPTIRLKAHELGIEAQIFKDEIFPLPQDQYKGYVEVYVSQTTLNKLFDEETRGFSVKEIYKGNEIEWFENEFVKIQSETSSALGRYTQGRIVPLKYANNLPNGYKALNLEQRMFWEALLAPPEEAPLLVIKGAAGTGKTYCSLAMALERLVKYANNGIYKQILVATPIVTVADERIGFLPGDIDSKVGPYLGGINDNLKETFAEKDPYADNRELQDRADELFERGYIEIQPIGFIRGRTIHHKVLIVDETQNIKPSDIVDIVTREGEGAKFIFLGDPDQVNNPELNSRYNGLVYLSEKMKGSSNCYQVTLGKSVRSAVAQEALEIL